MVQPCCTTMMLKALLPYDMISWLSSDFLSYWLVNPSSMVGSTPQVNPDHVVYSISSPFLCPLYSPPHSHQLYNPLFGREFHSVDCIYTSPSPFYQPLVLKQPNLLYSIYTIYIWNKHLYHLSIYIHWWEATQLTSSMFKPGMIHPTVAGPIPWKSCGTKARCKHSTSGENRNLTIQNGGSPWVLIEKIMGCRTNTRMVVWWDLMRIYWGYDRIWRAYDGTIHRYLHIFRGAVNGLW